MSFELELNVHLWYYLIIIILQLLLIHIDFLEAVISHVEILHANHSN